MALAALVWATALWLRITGRESVLVLTGRVKHSGQTPCLYFIFPRNRAFSSSVQSPRAVSPGVITAAFAALCSVPSHSFVPALLRSLLLRLSYLNNGEWAEFSELRCIYYPCCTWSALQEEKDWHFTSWSAQPYVIISPFIYPYHWLHICNYEIIRRAAWYVVVSQHHHFFFFFFRRTLGPVSLLQVSEK